jgi:hypothetical protein
MRRLPWLDDSVFYVVIVLALIAGAAASYGRELEAQRQPDRRWWLRRLLIMPLLAIVATASAEAFDLSKSVAAFTAAMLSLGGYDGIRLIEDRWRARISAATRDVTRTPTAGSN